LTVNDDTIYIEKVFAGTDVRRIDQGKGFWFSGLDAMLREYYRGEN
jgi:hypothetical protein